MVFYIRNNTIKIDKSPVHGKGVFANTHFEEGDILGIAMKRHSFTGNPDKDFFRTAMGRYINHSYSPNARLVQTDLFIYVLQALTPLRPGQEILVDYADFESQMYKRAKANLVNVEKYFEAETNKNEILLNESALEALKRAKDDLPEGYNFRIFNGFWTQDDQDKIYKETERMLKKEHDNWKELLKKYMGNSSKSNPMDHRSGNAIDLKLFFKGKEVDLGGQKMDERDRIDYKNINKNVRDNRMLLKKVLEKHGFKNNPDEWWHWGYDK